MLGFHFCYGDLAHHHMIEPADLGLSVRMAKLAIAQAKRRVDWVHMPVPMNRNDDAYFGALREWQSDDTEVFLGLIHFQDGVEGSLARAGVARRYLEKFRANNAAWAAAVVKPFQKCSAFTVRLPSSFRRLPDRNRLTGSVLAAGQMQRAE